MIITKTPFRMSFLGGGTDFPDFYREHGGAVISTTFDKYCYVTVRRLPPFFEYANELVYSRTERVNSLDEINHPAIREAMKWLDLRGLRVTYEADLPARTGLGTSSSFAVGMLNAFYTLRGDTADKRKLADDAIYLERVLCKENGGVQDQIAASFGGFNRIDFGADGYCVSPVMISAERKKELSGNLMLFFTGFSRFSSDVQAAHQSALANKTAQLLEMKSLVDDAESILTGTGSLSEFGRLLDYSWRLKVGITDKVSTDSINGLYSRALGAGALGGKLLGAGGGGFLLFYVEDEYKPAVRRALSNLMEVPFDFEDAGTEILYCTPETHTNSEGLK